MPKTKQQKQQVINQIRELLDKAKLVIISTFNHIKVKDQQELKNQLKDKNSFYGVFKKTLLNLVFKERGMDEKITEELQDSISLAAVSGDESAAAKVLAQFAKDKEGFKIHWALLAGQMITEGEVKELAKIPNREVLLGQLVSALKSPLSGLANVLSANQRNLITVLSQIKK
jgi:large subunit ribosomal protein L10